MARAQLDRLEASSVATNEALNRIKVDARQASETATSVAAMERSLKGLRDALVVTGEAAKGIGPSEEQIAADVAKIEAAEKAVAALRNVYLETDAAARGMGPSVGETAEAIGLIEARTAAVKQLRDAEIEAAAAAEVMGAANLDTWAKTERISQMNNSEILRTIHNSAAAQFFQNAAMERAGSALAPSLAERMDSRRMSDFSGQMNQSELIRQVMQQAAQAFFQEVAMNRAAQAMAPDFSGVLDALENSTRASQANQSELLRLMAQQSAQSYFREEAMLRAAEEHAAAAHALGPQMDAANAAARASAHNQAELLRVQMLRDLGDPNRPTVGPFGDGEDLRGPGQASRSASRDPFDPGGHLAGGGSGGGVDRPLMFGLSGGDSDRGRSGLFGLLFGSRSSENEASRVGSALEREAARIGGGGGGGSPGLSGRGLFGGILPGGARASAGFITTALGVGIAAAPVVGTAAVGAGLGITAGIGALAGGAGVLALAFGDLSKAAFTTQKAFDKLTPAQQQFVQTLRSLDAGLVKNLEGQAQRIVIPGVTAAIRSAITPASVAALTGGVQSFGSAVSGGAQQAGKLFGSTEFAKAFGAVLQADARYLRDMIDGTLHLVDAFVHLQQAAIPLTDWMDKGILRLAKLADASTRAGQASGGLARFFDRARVSLQTLGHLVGSVGDLFGSMFAAIGFGNSIATINLISRAIKDLANFVNANRNTLRDFFTGAIAAASNVLNLLNRLLQALTPILTKLDELIGGARGWQVAFEVLLAYFTGKFVVGMILGFAKITLAAEVTAGVSGTAGVGKLKFALMALAGADVFGALAKLTARLALFAVPITIPILLLVYRHAVDKGVGDFLDSHGLGFLGGTKESQRSVAELQKMAQGGGANADLAKGLLAQIGNAPVVGGYATKPPAPIGITPPGPIGSTGQPAPTGTAGVYDSAAANIATYKQMTAQAAAQYGIPVDVFEAQINAESGFNPHAVSKAGAEGIAQFMPGTAKGFGLTTGQGGTVFDPSKALPAAAKMMAGLINKYNGDIGLALEAYNAGPARVGQYIRGERALPAETTAYRQNILGASNSTVYGSDPAFGKPAALDQGGGATGNVLPQNLQTAIDVATFNATQGASKRPEIAALKIAIAWIKAHIGGTSGVTRQAYAQEGTSLAGELSSLIKIPAGQTIPFSGTGVLPARVRERLLAAETRAQTAGSVSSTTPFSGETLRANLMLVTQLEAAQKSVSGQIENGVKGSKHMKALLEEQNTLANKLAAAHKIVGYEIVHHALDPIEKRVAAAQGRVASFGSITASTPFGAGALRALEGYRNALETDRKTIWTTMHEEGVSAAQLHALDLKRLAVKQELAKTEGQIGDQMLHKQLDPILKSVAAAKERVSLVGSVSASTPYSATTMRTYQGYVAQLQHEHRKITADLHNADLHLTPTQRRDLEHKDAAAVRELGPARQAVGFETFHRATDPATRGVIAAETRIANLGGITASTPYSAEALRAAQGLVVQLAHQLAVYKAQHATKAQLLKITDEQASAERKVTDQVMARIQVPVTIARTRLDALGGITASTPYSSEILKAAIGVSVQTQHQLDQYKLIHASKKDILQATKDLAAAEKDVGQQLTAQRITQGQHQLDKILGIAGDENLGVGSIKKSERTALINMAKHMATGPSTIDGVKQDPLRAIPGFANLSIPNMIKALEAHGAGFTKAAQRDFSRIQNFVSFAEKNHLPITQQEKAQIIAYLAQISDHTRALKQTDRSTYHLPSVAELMKGLKGTPAVRRALAERLTAVEALGGKIPGGPAAFGFDLGPHGETRGPHPAAAHIPSPGGVLGRLMSRAETHVSQQQLVSGLFPQVTQLPVKHPPVHPRSERSQGAGDVIVSGDLVVNIEGQFTDPAAAARAIHTELSKSARRNPTQTKGPNAGRNRNLN